MKSEMKPEMKTEEKKVVCDLSGWGEDINTSLYEPNYNLPPRQPEILKNRSRNPAKTYYAEYDKVMRQTQFGK